MLNTYNVMNMKQKLNISFLINMKIQQFLH